MLICEWYRHTRWKNSGDLKKERFYLMDDSYVLVEKKFKKIEIYDLRSSQFRWKLFQRENFQLNHWKFASDWQKLCNLTFKVAWLFSLCRWKPFSINFKFSLQAAVRDLHRKSWSLDKERNPEILTLEIR